MNSLSNKLRTAARNYSEYRRIVSEIEGLSRREADDIGISTSDARRIAHETVYGG